MTDLQPYRLESGPHESAWPPVATIPAEPNRAMAHWALVLAICPCLLGTAPLALIFAIVVLVRSRDGRNHGQGFAIASIILLGIWTWAVIGVVILAATQPDIRNADGEIVRRGAVAVSDLRVGDCFIMPDPDQVMGEGIAGVEGVPCAEEHDAEVFARFDLDSGTFPGRERVNADADEGCRQRATAPAGGGAGHSPQAVFSLSPVEESWNRGDRNVICIVVPAADRPPAGTVQASGR